MQPLTVTAIKDFSLSSDGTQATFTLATKYAGDIAVTLPAECLKVFRSAVGDAEAVTQRTPAVLAQPAPEPPLAAVQPVNLAPAAPTGAAQVKANGGGSAPANPAELRVVVPKKWGVGAETEKHGVVLIFIDPGAPNQSGFALEPKAAKEMAQALVAKADAVAARKDPAAKPPRSV